MAGSSWGWGILNEAKQRTVSQNFPSTVPLLISCVRHDFVLLFPLLDSMKEVVRVSPSSDLPVASVGTDSTKKGVFPSSPEHSLDEHQLRLS